LTHPYKGLYLTGAGQGVSELQLCQYENFNNLLSLFGRVIWPYRLFGVKNVIMLVKLVNLINFTKNHYERAYIKNVQYRSNYSS